jgi:Pyridoxamine 5'-phosphate oxidase
VAEQVSILKLWSVAQSHSASACSPTWPTEKESRRLQDGFDTRRIAGRLEHVTLCTAFTDSDRAFVEGQSFFFLATGDADGRPTSTLKGGTPEFVRVISPDVRRRSARQAAGWWATPWRPWPPKWQSRHAIDTRHMIGPRKRGGSAPASQTKRLNSAFIFRDVSLLPERAKDP